MQGTTHPQGFPIRRKEKMNRLVANLIAVAERSERGYADVPPGSVTVEIESESAAFGYAIALSDRLWLGGFRIYSPESIQAGNYRSHILPSIFTCASSQFAHVPDARDFVRCAEIGPNFLSRKSKGKPLHRIIDESILRVETPYLQRGTEEPS